MALNQQSSDIHNTQELLEQASLNIMATYQQLHDYLNNPASPIQVSLNKN